MVTFYRLPTGRDQKELATEISPLLGAAGKKRYSVEGYFVHLGMPPETLVRRSAYWYSVWSHRRNLAWKGFVEIPLGPDDDELAAENVARILSGEEPS